MVISVAPGSCAGILLLKSLLSPFPSSSFPSLALQLPRKSRGFSRFPPFFTVSLHARSLFWGLCECWMLWFVISVLQNGPKSSSFPPKFLSLFWKQNPKKNLSWAQTLPAHWEWNTDIKYWLAKDCHVHQHSSSASKVKIKQNYKCSCNFCLHSIFLSWVFRSTSALTKPELNSSEPHCIRVNCFTLAFRMNYFGIKIPKRCVRCSSIL